MFEERVHYLLLVVLEVLVLVDEEEEALPGELRELREAKWSTGAAWSESRGWVPSPTLLM
jgi:hypothetical protein